MTENKSIRVKDIEVNKGQIYGLPKNPRFIRDEVADRIAGAIVDLAYAKQENPKIAVEVLIGHSLCSIITESSVIFEKDEVEKVVRRIAKEECEIMLSQNKQDINLANNQSGIIKCGDNGIFKGAYMSEEERLLTILVKQLYEDYNSDGKYIIKDNNTLIACQSKCDSKELYKELSLKMPYYNVIVNPLGDWSGGINVDTGATNRKLGSDMGRGVTGGGLHGKDLSKADVSLNIYLHILAQQKKRDVSSSCAIGDKCVVVGDNVIPYRKVVDVAKNFIRYVGGFEKFAEYGLIF